MKKIRDNIFLLVLSALFLIIGIVYPTLCHYENAEPILTVSAEESLEEEYTVYFIIYGTGSEPLTQTGKRGTKIEFPSLDTTEGYEFLGWIDVEGNPAPTHIPAYDTAVYANWKANVYEATVIDENGNKWKKDYTAKTAKDMAWILNTYFLPEPSAEYTYTWDKELPEVFPLKNATYTIFKTPVTYTLTFDGVENLSPISFTVETLNDLQFPTVPEKEHYIGTWDKTVEEIKLENTILTPVYTPKKYTITFEGVENIAPIVFTVETIDTVTLPPIPDRAGYTGEWNITADDLKLEDTTITAIYRELSPKEKWSAFMKEFLSTGCGGVVGGIISNITALAIAFIILLKK